MIYVIGSGIIGLAIGYKLIKNGEINLKIDEKIIQPYLERRKPGTSKIVTQ